MELRDPKLRERFENYVMSLQKPQEKKLSREFLVKFLELLIPGIKENPKAPKGFPVSAQDAAKLYNLIPSKFSRLVVGRRSDWEPSHKEFYEGIDYVQPNSDELWMTNECFARASMKMKKGRGNEVRLYFHLVDQGLRDIMGYSLGARFLYRNPLPSELAEKQPPYSTLGSKGIPGNYDFAWTKNGQRFRYSGITDDYNTRIQTHVALKGGAIDDKHFKSDPMPLFKELCLRRYYGDHKLAVPDNMRGFDDLFVDDSKQWPLVRKFCDEMVDEADRKFATSIGFTGSSERGVILPDPSLYPRSKEKKTVRKRRHSWLQAPVAHYEFDERNHSFNPNLVLRGPKLPLKKPPKEIVHSENLHQALDALFKLKPSDANRVIEVFRQQEIT
jgi:hypothetical protein